MNPAMGSGPHVILVHGLWFGSWSMARLARKLGVEGFRVRRFSYSSTAAGLAEHAAELRAFALQAEAAQLHFVSHSLGGLLTLMMLNEFDDIPPGRVVMLGSPLVGSIIARRSGRVPGNAKLLGEVREALHRGYDRIPEGRETGMIAGTRGIGLGVLVGGVGGRGDGTVAVRETRAEGLQDHLELPVTHTGLIYSREVARQAAFFLRTGGFHRSEAC